MTHARALSLPCLLALLVGATLPNPAAAQLNSQNIKGDVGLKSGSQAPPGGYVVAPLYFYSADALKNRDGQEVATGSLDATVFGPGLNYVTTKKIGGANYGFLVVLPWANNRIQGGRVDENPGQGITDMYVQPVNLGWHGARADTTVAYGLYVPTGRYEDGASNNTGLGMWGHELQAGTTVYLDQARTWHAATTASFNFHSEKKDSDTRVGNALTLEGGAGRDFLGGGLSLGMAYYATYKLTEDRLGPVAGVLVRGKNRVYGVGPEATLAIAARQTVYGFVTVRYQWEMGARTTTEGGALNIMATFLLKPLKLAPAPAVP
ncbi:transporter [Luteitalea sp.]|jgi:hypothetical protein|uniref:SphA family protein n=1 Tax=Luteitalea sp. TaxID=2004800 RepID=UPI0037C7510C